MNTKDLAKKLSTSELEELLNEKRTEEREAAVKKRKAYESGRDKLVVSLCKSAIEQSNRLKKFKEQVMFDVGAFEVTMSEHSTAKKVSKGNFELVSEDGLFKVLVAVQSRKAFDERAREADKLLREFLQTVSGRNKEAYKIASTLLERKQNGEYDVRLIQRLYKMENDYDDVKWIKAIQLFKEAYRELESAKYVRFYEKSLDGPWELINISFSSL